MGVLCETARTARRGAASTGLPEGIRLGAAKAMIAAKMRNRAAVLRRHANPVRMELRQLAQLAEAACSAEELFGLEGHAAARYFPELAVALSPSWAVLHRRESRPARDAVNAALNLVYGLLLADVLRGVVACGLDPSGGVLHTAKRNKPALALDLMEEFRAPVADSAVLWAINNGEVSERDFRRDFDAVRLTERGRKALIAAYERRASAESSTPSLATA